MFKVFLAMTFAFIFGLTLAAAGMPPASGGFWLLIGVFTAALSFAVFVE